MMAITNENSTEEAVTDIPAFVTVASWISRIWVEGILLLVDTAKVLTSK